MARAPDVIAKTFAYRGDAARALAELLVLPGDGAYVFELSQAAEHRALPARDAALRDPDGMLSSELGWRTSTQIREAIEWRGDAVQLDGYVADLATAYPHGAGPQFTFMSPGFVSGAAPAGWSRVVASFTAFPAVAGAGGVETKTRTMHAGGERVIATLTKWPTYDAKNQPIEIWFATIAIGPWLAASTTTGDP